MDALNAVHLRVEYRENPLGVDASQPRLSWILEGTGRNRRQSAYRILVASSIERLNADEGDLWDSGKVESNRTIHIEYGGVPLPSRTACVWKVRAWDESDRPGPFSEPARWTMGLLEPCDWHATWIGYDEPLEPEVRGPEPLSLDGYHWVTTDEPAEPGSTLAFRTACPVPPARPLARARLVAAAGGQFRLLINGAEVGGSDGRFWAWQRPVQFDITAALKPGDNVIAVENTFAHCPAPGLIARLILEFDDGECVESGTDDTWRVAIAPDESWRLPGFGDSAWPAARIAAKAGEGPWGTLRPAPMEIPPCPYLRKPFTAAKPVRRATAYASALGLYELRLNGVKVGRDMFTPGWTDYATRVLYQTYDVTELIERGENALGAVLGHGWYSGYLGWEPNRGHYGQHPRLLVQLEIEYADGSADVVVSDTSWRASHGPIIGGDLYMGEQHDARRERPGWDRPGYDASAWRPAAAAAPTDALLQAYPGVPVRAVMELAPQSVSEPVPGTFVFDMGQNMVGWARLRVTGAPGDKVQLRFAEMLNPDGTVYVENLRGARCIDEHWLRGGAEEVCEPRFTFHGFRYVELTGYPGRPGPDAVTGIVAHSDTPPAGSFECSHPLINQLQCNIVWGQRGNFLEVPTDCPQRDERLGWMGDAQVFARTASFNMDTAAFFTKWMQDVVDGQSDSGGFPNVAPRAVVENDAAAAWGDAGIIVPWTIYQCYGDTRMLERYYGPMQGWIEHLRARYPGLLWTTPVPGVGEYGDWLSNDADTPKDVVVAAYFAYSTDLLARIAQVLGRWDDARRYARLFEEIKTAFVREYVDDDGRIQGATQTCYVLALRFNLLPEELRAAAAAHLVEDIRARDGHLSTGFLGGAYLMPVLSDAGHTDVAYGLVQNESFPSWGYSIRHGATTIWERWDGWTEQKGFQDPGMNSFNHYAYGAVGEWLYRYVAGIDLDPAAPAYERIVIRPRPGGGLTHARAEYESIRGRIFSSWQIQNGRFCLDVTIPANTVAAVHLPASPPEAVTESGKPAAAADGVTCTASEGGAAVFQIGSGTYRFECPVE
ncbi:MAG: family 78 glycoside hydrolase catalytic domain [Candidatus Hydrogenedentes bacterium]|nr:family 78 glycoside hydrolase catalytic domain [Candidatus Hydrogenedentota bacterium]